MSVHLQEYRCTDIVVFVLVDSYFFHIAFNFTRYGFVILASIRMNYMELLLLLLLLCYYYYYDVILIVGVDFMISFELDILV
jgi:hypothetical protein